MWTGVEVLCCIIVLLGCKISGGGGVDEYKTLTAAVINVP